MKKLLVTVCFSILLTQAHAQKESQESKISIDSMLVNIDKSAFTSGILYDRVTDWAELSTFNDDAKNISNNKHFEQALHELYKASNQQKFAYYKDLRKKYTKSKQQGVVDIGILNASFHQLNYNQEDESKGGLRVKENKFESIEGKNPFVLKHLFLVSPLKGYLKGQSITYKFDDSFLFDVATTKKIVSLTVDFDTNKNYTVYENGVFTNKTIQINYSESGYKTLTCTAIYADGTQQTTKAQLHVKVLNATMMRDPIADGTHDDIHDSTIAFQGYSYDENETTPIYGQLEYRIFYHKDSNGAYERTLLKPIVIIDGFDPGDLRKIQDSDDHPNSSDEDHESIEEMMIYYNSTGRKIEIINELRKSENGGYDVIIVNHPNYSRGTKDINGGADYIERNGRAHASFYKELNATILANGSSEELVIIGPSMGGQVSRYALAYMEKKHEETNDEQWQHHVRLWVSVDSPHLGANIPLGTQALLNMVASTGNTGAIDFVEIQLDSPAAKQQLIEQFSGYNSGRYLKQDHLNARTVSQGYSEDRGNPFFVDFYNNLYANGLSESRGYPQSLRKIALVNGSLTGSKKYKNPFKPNWYTLNENNGLRDDVYANSNNKVLDITGVKNILGVRIIGARLKSYSMPGLGSYKLVARFFRKKDPYYDRFLYVTNNNTRGNMDNVSGGWFPTQQKVAKETIESMPSSLSWYELRRIKHANSFISTISSLGFKNPDFKWGELIDPSLLCDDEIPFDTFFAPKDNEAHTSFTETSVEWLFEELAGHEQSIPDYANPTITGDPEVYTGQIVTYTIPKIAKATSYTWDLDFNYNTTNYTPWTLISGQGTNSITVRAGSPKIGIISCVPRNSCATGRMSYKHVRSYNTVGDGDGGNDDPCDDSYRLTMSPNPNKGNILILRLEYLEDPCDEIDPFGDPFKQQIKNTVEIFDMYGIKKYSGEYTSNNISITGLYLRMGVYVVHLITAKGIRKEKMLMIE